MGVRRVKMCNTINYNGSWRYTFDRQAISPNLHAAAERSGDLLIISVQH